MNKIIVNLKHKLSFLKNSYQDCSIKSKILIIESDDWGSIRMPSIKSYENLLRNDIPVDRCPFLKYDSFETISDFEALYGCLSDFKDINGKPPIITANYILANPDYKKIEDSNFSEYHREFFWDYLKRFDLLANYKSLLDKGIKLNYIKPQLHGLEHLNVPYWMSSLNSGMEETKIAFLSKVYGISTTITKENRRTYLAALDYANQTEFINYTKPSLELAYSEFERFFGFKSKSFIAPNYVWSNQIEELLYNLGVKTIQSSRYQKMPVNNNLKGKKRNTGSISNGLLIGVRNVVFEPTAVMNKKAHLNRAIDDINLAFTLNKPAIITMHRLNFMGGLDIYNRNENLELLHELITRVKKKWPQIQFESTDNLTNILDK